MECPKCKAEMKKRKLHQGFNIEFDVNTKGDKKDKVPVSYVCEKCGYVELYVNIE